MNRRVITMAFLLLTIVTAMANDGVYYTSGNQLVPLRETDIQVKKEILTIDVSDPTFARVDVYYEFLNPTGKEKTLLMGFEADPPYSPDGAGFYEDGANPNIVDFNVEFNGNVLMHDNAVAALGKEFKPLNVKEWKLYEDYGDAIVRKDNPDVVLNHFAYVYYFNATFRPGINKVHHTYSYRKSMSVGMSFSVPYKLSPAARWANGCIDDFTLIVKSDQPRHFVINRNALDGATKLGTTGKVKTRVTKYYDTPMWEIAISSGTVVFTATKFKPSAEEELSISSADLLYFSSEQSKLGDYYDRDNAMMLFYDGEVNRQKIAPALRKRIIKNLPYAHRGHVFKDAALKKYFESLFWYIPNPEYKDDTSGFTKSDWEYVNRGK